VDDTGRMVWMYSGARPARLLAAVQRAAVRSGASVPVRRLLPGILVDAVAFADAGWEVLTLSKGSARTLARIHTRRDTLHALSGMGADDAARLLAQAARELV
jgi:hypothetical protein